MFKTDKIVIPLKINIQLKILLEMEWLNYRYYSCIISKLTERNKKSFYGIIVDYSRL